MITDEFRYLYLGGVVLECSAAGWGLNFSVLVTIGIGTDGYRQILGICEGQKEDLKGWCCILGHLRNRVLAGVQLVISDACRGLMGE